MKKLIVGMVFILASVGLFAQSSNYFSVLPGYQFQGNHMDSSFVGSFDAGYFYSDNVGLHVGLIYNPGEFDYFKKSFEILEAGVEFATTKGDTGQFYGQLNLGSTLGLGSSNYYYRTSNVATYGAALGYRYYFNDTTGINIQGAYHKLGSGGESFSDVRIGIVFRF